jgi:hypothetical protein
MRARWVVGFGTALALAVASGAMVGCGSSQTSKFGNIKAGEMPSGESWVGVYFNPVYGNLHMIEQEGSIVGRWKRTDGSHWGEMSGTAEGNVLHFAWKEHTYGAVGPHSDKTGTGVFVYKPGEAAPELDGKYSIEGGESVGDWHCVKQVNIKPDLGSINGDNPGDAPAAQDKWQ